MTRDPFSNADAWGAEPSADDESRRRRQRILSLIRGRERYLIAAALLLGVLLGVGGFFLEGPRYVSLGQFQIDPLQPDIQRGRAEVPPMWETQVATWFSQINGPTVVDGAMRSDTWRAAVQETGQNLSAEEFAESIAMTTSRNSTLVTVRFRSENPQLAQAGLNATMNTFHSFFKDEERKNDDDLDKVLRQRKGELITGLSNREERLQNLTDGQGKSQLLAQYDALVSRQLELESQETALDRRLNSSGSETPGLQDLSVEDLAAIDGTLADLRQRREAAGREVERMLLDTFSENHPTVRRANAGLMSLDRQIADRVDGLRRGDIVPSINTTSNLAQLREQQQQVKGQLEVLKNWKSTLSTQIKNAETTLQEIEAMRQELALIDNRLQAISLKDSFRKEGGKLSVVFQPATPPKEPANLAARIKKAAVGGILGMGLGAGFIFGLGFINPRLRHAEEVQLDLPEGRLLGILPTLPTQSTDPDEAAHAAHSVHHIRTLLQIGREPTGNVFAITSPGPGSGKTSLTVALGLSFASSGHRTLVIDADLIGSGMTRRMGFVVRPRLGQILKRKGQIEEPHIQDALRVARSTGSPIGEALVDLGYVSRDEVDAALQRQKKLAVGLLDACDEHHFEECVAATGVNNLSLLPTGAATPNQSAALSPGLMRRVVKAARKHYDTVLIDTGPLLGSLDASLAAAEADATVLVVSRGEQRGVIQRCVEHLNSVGGTLAGMVFNHATPDDMARSSFASNGVSKGRAASETGARPVSNVDADTSSRFGPIGTAVASYAAGAGDDEEEGVVAVAGNGRGTHNGHAHP